MTIGHPSLAAVLSFVFGFALVALPSDVNAQAPVDGLRLTLDKEVYFSDFDTTATVTLEGAAECAGQTVRIGFAGGGQPVEVRVSSAGRASVPVPLVPGSSPPFVEGDCIPGGRFVADRLSPGGPYIDRVPPIPLEIRSDKAEYVPGDVALLSVQGLGPCVGQSVWLGLFYNDGYRVRSAMVEVDSYGRAQAEILMEGLPFSGARPGVRGECVVPGYYLGPEPVTFSGSTGPSTPRFSFDIPSPHRPLVIRISVEGFTECALERPVLVGLYDALEHPVKPGASSFAHGHVGLDGGGSGKLFVNSPNADGYTARLAISGDCVPGGMISSEELFVIPAIAPDPPPEVPPLNPRESSIVAPVAILEYRLDEHTLVRWLDRLPVLNVLADGRVCGRWELRDGSHDRFGNAIFVLGSEGQPPGCWLPGAEICLEVPADSGGHALHYRYDAQPGQVIIIESFAPSPPHAPGCRAPGPPNVGKGLLGSGWPRSADGTAAMLVLMLAAPFLTIAVRRSLKDSRKRQAKGLPD